jgi:hypothetical protein
VFGWLKSPELLERAEIAAKQMRYFRLFSEKGSFGELDASAKRAGFAMTFKDPFRKEASFQWGAGEPDIIFSVSFQNPAAISVLAESYVDIFGLIMLSYSNLPNISVDVKPSLQKRELGRNALRFRKILLSFPDFDAGIEEILTRRRT